MYGSSVRENVTIVTKCLLMISYQQLSNCPVFKGVSENESARLLGQIQFQVKNFSRDEVIALAGKKIRSLYIVLSGSVRGEVIDYSGNTIKIEDIEAPRPMAVAFLFGTANAFPVTISANNEVRLLVIPLSEFLRLLQMSTRLLENYLNSISSRSQFLSQKIHFLNYKTIKEKMAHYLLQKAGDRFHSVELEITQEELAGLFGVSRPSLARVLAEMQKEKLIVKERKTITLVNKEKLNQLLIYG